MAVNDMSCPNCGAPVDFAGSIRAICSFCRSQLYLTDDGVKASSVLSDLLENQPVTRGVDLDRVRQLAHAGQKIEAIRLLREQTDLGLKAAKDAVEAIAGPFVTGKISGGDTSSSAHFSVPIYGPRQGGELNVSGIWRKGVWELSILVSYDRGDGEERTLQIARKVK